MSAAARRPRERMTGRARPPLTLQQKRRRGRRGDPGRRPPPPTPAAICLFAPSRSALLPAVMCELLTPPAQGGACADLPICPFLHGRAPCHCPHATCTETATEGGCSRSQSLCLLFSAATPPPTPLVILEQRRRGEWGWGWPVRAPVWRLASGRAPEVTSCDRSSRHKFLHAYTALMHHACDCTARPADRRMPRMTSPACGTRRRPAAACRAGACCHRAVIGCQTRCTACLIGLLHHWGSLVTRGSSAALVKAVSSPVPRPATPQSVLSRHGRSRSPRWR